VAELKGFAYSSGELGNSSKQPRDLTKLGKKAAARKILHH
jgi:hypothetical protein